MVYFLLSLQLHFKKEKIVMMMIWWLRSAVVYLGNVTSTTLPGWCHSHTLTYTWRTGLPLPPHPDTAEVLREMSLWGIRNLIILFLKFCHLTTSAVQFWCIYQLMKKYAIYVKLEYSTLIDIFRSKGKFSKLWDGSQDCLEKKITVATDI